MDTERLLRLLKENKATFVIIGATALPVYGYARATLDIDLFVKPDPDNIKRVIKALKEFGYDLMDLTPEDFLKNKILIRQYTVEADIHPFVKGVSFDEVWKNKIKAKFGKTEVYFPSLDDMIKMKKAAGRAIDREDLKYLRRIKLKASPPK
ncbi:MAG: nucleotidyl transferase AbiEii/AbiGii toxin family protein [Clostridiales bacterium]|jgi:predicted nucleotidyltransferase|nr:nucleotidyl transferase AbiEii/AbiGii toxin family protein [Clostridiales bacterium]